MSHASLLDRDRAALVVIDVQEAFRPAVEGFEDTAARVAVLVRGARELGVPVHVTEQYPKGLGRTVPEVADALGDEAGRSRRPSSRPAAPTASTSTAATRRSSAGSRPTCASRRPSTTCSTEGVQVHVPVDAVSSRARPPTSRSGWRRWTRAGALPSSVETALLELVGAAGSDEFKAIQGLIK